MAYDVTWQAITACKILAFRRRSVLMIQVANTTHLYPTIYVFEID